jgi:hypothetical protein
MTEHTMTGNLKHIKKFHSHVWSKKYEYELWTVGPSEVIVTKFCVLKMKPMTLCLHMYNGEGDLSFCYQNET